MRHPRNIDLAKLVNDCRMKVSTAYYNGGDPAALVALACGSVVLQHHADAGSLVPEAAFRDLEETAVNLGMVDRLGVDIVGTALDCGAMFYDQLDDVIAARPKMRAAA